MDAQKLFHGAILIKRKYDQQCKPILQEYDLRPSDLDVLMYLAFHPECQTAREISECRMLAKSLVSSSVDALTRKGLLAGEIDPTDRRRVLLTLLPPAREIVEQTLRLSQRYFDQALSGISEEDSRVLERAMARICRNLEEADDASSA